MNADAYSSPLTNCYDSLPPLSPRPDTRPKDEHLVDQSEDGWTGVDEFVEGISEKRGWREGMAGKGKQRTARQPLDRFA